MMEDSAYRGECRLRGSAIIVDFYGRERREIIYSLSVVGPRRVWKLSTRFFILGEERGCRFPRGEPT